MSEFMDHVDNANEGKYVGHNEKMTEYFKSLPAYVQARVLECSNKLETEQELREFAEYIMKNDIGPSGD